MGISMGQIILLWAILGLIAIAGPTAYASEKPIQTAIEQRI